MQNAQSIAMEVRRVASAQGVILFDPTLLPQAEPRLHDARAWDGAEPLDGRGGRGSAVLVHGPFGEGILRHYRRGGLIGRCIKDRYVYLGEARTRCVREFRLLLELCRRGLPAPQPVFAAWRREGMFYRADLLTRRIPASRTLAECLRQAVVGVPWVRVGASIARFHREGAFHADLNAHNVLLDAQGAVWLIDFDRGELRVPAQGWQQANLRRLRRSLDKLGGVAEGDWSVLLEGYAAVMAGAAPDALP